MHVIASGEAVVDLAIDRAGTGKDKPARVSKGRGQRFHGESGYRGK